MKIFVFIDLQTQPPPRKVALMSIFGVFGNLFPTKITLCASLYPSLLHGETVKKLLDGRTNLLNMDFMKLKNGPFSFFGQRNPSSSY